MEVNTLYDNEWLQLKEMKAPEHDINGYVFSHEVRCGGKIIAVLPYHDDQIVLREEVTPCWHPTEPQLSSITGGVEDDDVITTVLEELLEEANIKATEDQLISLGICRGTKSTDTEYHLYAIEVDPDAQDLTAGQGDGSELERKAKCVWYDIEDAHMTVDPLVSMLLIRLQSQISEAEE